MLVLESVSYRYAGAARPSLREVSLALPDGEVVGLADPASFAGHRAGASTPSVVLLEHHGLGIEIVIDREHPVGRDDPAGDQRRVAPDLRACIVVALAHPPASRIHRSLP